MSPVAEVLERTAASGELHHAVILHGPSRETLRTLALKVARRLVCPLRCEGDCPACGRVERGLHPDVHFVSVAADRKLISIEHVREAVAEAMLRPYEGRGKVFIVDPADAMSAGAANSLLKTLEEPVPDTTFILLTRSADLLLPTIRSRCQALYVGPELQQDGATASEGVPLQLARLRRDAPLFGEAGKDNERFAAEVLDALDRSAAGETAALLELAAAISAEDDAADRIGLLVSMLRDLVSLDPGQTVDREKARRIRAAIPAAALLEAAWLGVRSSQRFAVNADARLVVEEMLLALVVPGASGPA